MVPLLLKFVVVVVDELLLPPLPRENECGSVGGVVRSMFTLLPMSLPSLLSLAEGGGGTVVLLLVVDRRRKTPLPLLSVSGVELVVASRTIYAFVGDSACKAGQDTNATSQSPLGSRAASTITDPPEPPRPSPSSPPPAVSSSPSQSPSTSSPSALPPVVEVGAVTLAEARHQAVVVLETKQLCACEDAGIGDTGCWRY